MMPPQQEHETFPLFKGATRLPTIAGVPMVPLMVMFMGVAVVALTVSIWWWALAIPLWFLMAQITKNDDKAFRILWLWIDTKLRNRNKGFWGASSYSPSNYRKRR
ncbi:Type IV secretion system protein virB3 [Oligella ureolytica]|uniref:Type IV secretion system protein virB3 n=2 Tax=Oligella ureolytica TaxID=90244 RepID=A0A379B0E1_9BURK|nr:VirB3 family type IV secretion system protein [Oligella ureolytica]SUB29765.1 Type IV secretion system protein virB3 [Oligella ureolytica]